MQGSLRQRRNRSDEIDELWTHTRGPLLAFQPMARIVPVPNMPSAEAPSIPQTQTAALVHELGGNVEFKTDHPVLKPRSFIPASVRAISTPKMAQ